MRPYARVDHCAAPPSIERIRRRTKSHALPTSRGALSAAPAACVRVIPREGEHAWPLARSIPRAWKVTLTRWYLRSPADIEDERRQRAEQAYNAFFGQRGDTPSDPTADDGDDAPSPDPTRPTWTQVGPSRWRSDASSPDHPRQVTDASTDGSYQLAAATSPSFWDYWSPQGCASCHGYTPGTLPPIGGQSPRPPTYSPRSGGGAGSGGSSGQPRQRYPQCEMQERQDRRICAQQPNERAKAVCNASATDRRSWCDNHEGEIGTPDLKTAYRKDGRRWP